tara:strand:- start:99 stop:563 length:465 start_codon:yes stop_codon:yes gene_type:complete
MVKKNEPLSFDKGSLPVKVVGKTKDDSAKLQKATKELANRNYDMSWILDRLESGRLTKSNVKLLANIVPKRYTDPVRAALAKFEVDKKRNKEKENEAAITKVVGKVNKNVERKRKKGQAPLRNVRKGGEFPKKHGGKITPRMTGGQVVSHGYDQ